MKLHAFRCLIVDETMNPGGMGALLQEQGISVVGGASRGAEALRPIAQLKPDVVLIDIDLGEESGLALARSLGDGASRAAVPHMILIWTHDEGEYADRS